jgi:hypothetical protein
MGYIIGRIVVKIKTGTEKRASNFPSDPVFVSIGGREFKINTTKNQFRKGMLDEFVLDENSDLLYPKLNRLSTGLTLPIDEIYNSPFLQYDDLDLFPKYVRYHPNSNTDDWNIDSIHVEVHEYIKKKRPTGKIRKFKSPIDDIWLSINTGLFIWLKEFH